VDFQDLAYVPLDESGDVVLVLGRAEGRLGSLASISLNASGGKVKIAIRPAKDCETFSIKRKFWDPVNTNLDSPRSMMPCR